MTKLCCPVCGSTLFLQKSGYRCKNNHCFDLAKEGYCNLLTGGKPSKAPGDNKEMARARHLFFSGDYYRILLDGLCQQGEKYLPFGSTLIDAGCGEGYYTAGIYKALSQKGIVGEMFGFDLSKFALRYAAKREPGASFFVSSIFSLPLPDQCADGLFSVFAPVAGREFGRVLRRGGFLFIALPGPRHLFGLKEVLYDSPYENPQNHYDLPDFSLKERREFSGEIILESRDDIQNLFLMTPYYWKTPREGVERLSHLEQLTTPIQFEVLTFEKT